MEIQGIIVQIENMEKFFPSNQISNAKSFNEVVPKLYKVFTWVPPELKTVSIVEIALWHWGELKVKIIFLFPSCWSFAYLCKGRAAVSGSSDVGAGGAEMMSPIHQRGTLLSSTAIPTKTQASPLQESQLPTINRGEKK